MTTREGVAGHPINLACSFFNNAEDAHPKPWSGTWPGLVGMLEMTNTPRPRPTGDDPKKGLPAIAPATFEPLHRGKDDARSLQLLGLDYDNSRDEVIPGEFHRSGTPKTRKVMIDRPVTLEEVSEILWDVGFAGYQWTTWSNRDGWPKFRAVVPMEAPVPAALWEQATEYALACLGLLDTRRGLDMGALRDVARMYFLPGHPGGAEAIARQEIVGKPLRIPVDELPAIAVPELPRLPHIERERERRRHGGYAWAGPLGVDLTTLHLAKLIASLGVKVGHERGYKGGSKWRTHCLWPDEHSHALDDDSGVVIHEPGRWPTWSCAHTCHTHLGLVDVLRAAGVVHD
ncbi:MAG TPA: hypothetical protein VJ486_10600 [Geothrix sp.]|nr:hypothetical protein [Geothrix sp.]